MERGEEKKGIRIRSRLDLWSFKDYGMGMSSTPRAVVSEPRQPWVGKGQPPRRQYRYVLEGAGPQRVDGSLSPLKPEAGERGTGGCCTGLAVKKVPRRCLPRGAHHLRIGRDTF